MKNLVKIATAIALGVAAIPLGLIAIQPTTASAGLAVDTFCDLIPTQVAGVQIVRATSPVTITEKFASAQSGPHIYLGPVTIDRAEGVACYWFYLIQAK
jgi:hypothetical protein